MYAIYQGIVFSHLLHQDRLIEIDKSLQTIRFSGMANAFQNLDADVL